MAYRWISKPQFILIVPVMLLMLTVVACGSEESTPTPQPTPTPIDVAGIVQQAISAQSGGATAEDVASEIAKAMAAQPGVTSTDVAEAIKSALAAQPGVNQEDVAMAIEKALQAQPGISPADVQAAVDAAVAKAIPAPRAISEGAIGYGQIGLKIEDFGEPKYGGVMEVHHQYPVATWNPHANTVRTPQFSPLYNSLLGWNAWTFDRFDIYPDLAESWTMVDGDPTVWDFKLKPHAKFWDGSQVTAEDVVYSFDRMLGRTEGHPDSQYDARQYVKPHFDRSEALDAVTVRIHLLHPWADFISYMADDMLTIVPKSHYLPLDQATAGGDKKFEWDTGVENILGSGPFMISQVKDKDTISFERNPDYWKKDPDGRSLPYLDGMNYYSIQDPSAAQAAWETEQVWNTQWQHNARLPAGQLREMVERSNGKFVAYPVPCCPQGFLVNPSKPPFDDARVRRALMLALDRPELNEIAWSGMGILGTTAGGPGHPLTMPLDEITTLPGYRTPKDADVAEAQRLLAEAGYPDGFDTTLAFTTPRSAALAATFQQQMKKFLNIRVKQLPLDGAATRELGANGKYDIITAGAGAGVVTPNQYLERWYLPDAPDNPHGWIYEGPEDLLDLIARQSQALDLFERRQIVREIEIITMTKDSHFINGFVRTFSRVFNTDKVAGQMPTQSGYLECKAEQLWLVNP
jgi:ABC-type transport system substrate-binding protein